jgi:hypothetical protein
MKLCIRRGEPNRCGVKVWPRLWVDKCMRPHCKRFWCVGPPAHMLTLLQLFVLLHPAQLHAHTLLQVLC